MDGVVMEVLGRAAADAVREVARQRWQAATSLRG